MGPARERDMVVGERVDMLKRHEEPRRDELVTLAKAVCRLVPVYVDYHAEYDDGRLRSDVCSIRAWAYERLCDQATPTK